MVIDIFDAPGAIEFFQFFEKYGLSWWWLEAIPRQFNRDGSAQKPIAKFNGLARPICGSAGMIKYINRLKITLAEKNKGRSDLYIRESPGVNIWHRVILVDDVKQEYLDELLFYWSGPAAVIETSSCNYQTLLISPKGLLSHDATRVTKNLAIRFCGDTKAARATQLHRFPGSPNFKKSRLIEGGQPFITKLFRLIDGESDGREQIDELLKSNISITKKAKKIPQKKFTQKSRLGEVDSSPSAIAIRWAMSALVSGVSSDAVLSALEGRFLGHHDPQDWPKRTLHNAEFFLGCREKKYEVNAGREL